MKRIACLAVLVACGDTATETAVEAPAPAASVAEAGPQLLPKPGIDLTGPIAAPRRGAPAHHHAQVSVALAADRTTVKLDAVVPPPGGAAPLQLPDDHAGWIARIAEGLQLPAVAVGDGHVYISGGFESRSMYALDAHTGAIAWSRQDLEDNGPTAVVFDRGRIVFNTESCTLMAIDAKTGKKLWHRWLGDPTLAQTAVSGALVYAAHPGDGGYALGAFAVANGEPVWSLGVAGELVAAPVVAGDSIYAATVNGITYRAIAATGRLVWARELDATTAPWITGGELYVTRQVKGKEQQVVASIDTGAIVRSQHEVDGKYVWDVPDTSAPKNVWAFEGSRPVIDRGVRYVAMGGVIHASDAATGEPMWERRYAGNETSRSVGSVALAGSAIVVATREGQLYGLDIDTGYTLWSYDIGHRVIAEPIVATGWVYAATEDGYVVALHVADETFDGWRMFGGGPGHDGAPG
jgi:outer membrane protein assembly factor BamB